MSLRRWCLDIGWAMADLGRAGTAAVWYSLATALMTWPLVVHVSSAVPADLIDPLLNCWIVGWSADHMLRAMAFDPAAIATFWHGNIFYPEPYALAYSEHLVAQTIQALPIVALTRNLVVAYNALFLSTFVLSALGVYLLVRELSGCSRSAFVAGLFYGFALYRAGQLGHLQVLSSQWMPFALYGIRRYFEGGRLRALAGAGAALVAQNLSCGYYLVYFSPFAALFVLYELVARRRLADRRAWLALGATALAVAAVTAPGVYPYFALRANGFPARPASEVDMFSANVLGYLTSFKGLGLWGRTLQTWVQPEGALFPGLLPVVCAMVAVAAFARRAWHASAGAARPREWARVAVCIAGTMAAAAAVWAPVILFSGPRIRMLRRISVSVALITNVWPVLFASLAVLLILSPRSRAFARGMSDSSVLFFASALALAFYLSLGRTVWTEAFRASGETLYGWLFRNVPGFDGLRVPSRFAMIASLFLSVLGGLGLREITRNWRTGGWVVMTVGLLFLAEAAVVPFPVRPLTWAIRSAGRATANVNAAEASRIYGYLRTLPPDSIVAELPFGQPEDEARYEYFSTSHWRRLVNGYSGGFPPSYRERERALSHPPDDPERAWRRLASDGVAVIIVHEWAFANHEGETVSDWLLSSGARQIAHVGDDRMFLIPR